MNNHIQVTLKSSTIEMNLNSPEESIYLIPELEGLTTLPEIRTSSGVNAGADGGWTSAQLFDARLISMRLVIANEDIAVVESKRRLLNTLLAQGRNEELSLNITTEAGNAYTVNVRVTSVSASLDRVLHKQDFLIQFRADDPLIYGSTEGGGVEAILNVQKALGGFAIPFTFPLAIGGGSDGTVVQNVGTETVYPIITLYGNLHSPTVINRTTNQQLQIIADLASDIIWGQSQTAQGEYIQVTNALDIPAKLASVEMLGKAEQDGTPTPDAPVAVETTTGENIVKIEGKNLLDSENAEFANGYISGSDGSFTSGGGSTASKNMFYLSVGTYTFSNTENRNLQRVCYFSKNKVFVEALTITSGKTFTMPSNGYVRIQTNGSTTLQSPQLEKGSTATAYEPYQGQEFEVNLGKNLLQYASRSASNGITTTQGADGTLTATGTATSTYADITATITDGVLAGTYTFSCTTSTGLNGARIALRFTHADNTTSTFDIPATAEPVAVNLTKDATKYYYFLRTTSATAYNLSLKLQLEKGSTATTYAPYFTPIELAKIGNYQDRIYKEDSKWYVEKQVGKYSVSLTGLYTLTGGLKGAICSPANKATSGGDALCDRATKTTGSNIWAGSFYENPANFMFVGTSTDDATSLKDKYDGATLYYALATPTTTEITNEALIAQLDALGASSLYLGVNNIGTETLNAMPTLELGYYTSYEKQTDVVVIDSQANTITLNGLDIYNLMTEGSEFIEIAPGDNIMLLTSTQTSDDGYAEIKYKQGYLSI